jgi:outer membrane protein TolC
MASAATSDRSFRAYRDAVLESKGTMKEHYASGAVTESDLRRADAALAEAEYWLDETIDGP